MNIHPFAEAGPELTRKAIDETKLLSGAYWAELRVFLGLAKSKSINMAARNLGVSKAKISRQVMRLQDLLGVQLVIHTRSGTVLTDAGRQLADILVDFDAALRSVTEDLRGVSERAEGAVRISVTDGLGLVVITPSLPALHRDHPRIQVHVKTPTNMQSLRENATDIMVGYSREQARDVTNRRLGTSHLIPFTSRSYIEEHGQPTRANLRDHLFVNTERYANQAGVWTDWNEAANQGRVAFFADAAVTYAYCIKLGLGIGLLPIFNVADPDFVPLDIGVHVELPIFAIALTERLRSRHVRIVFDFLTDLLGPETAMFAREMKLDLERDPGVEGYRRLFNL